MKNKWFEKNGEKHLANMSYGETFLDFTVEEMYQEFKARLSNELSAESHSLPKLHFDTLRHYIMEHEFDIEMNENDFGTLKGLLDFMRLVKYETKD